MISVSAPQRHGAVPGDQNHNTPLPLTHQMSAFNASITLGLLADCKLIQSPVTSNVD